MLFPMETFLTICFFVVAGVIVFWLIVWPALLLIGAGFAIVAGAIKGFLKGIRAGLKPAL